MEKNLLEALQRHFLSNDWITLLFLAVLILLTLLRSAYSYKFHDFIMLFFNDKYLFQKGREPKVFNTFNILMFLVNIISVSIFIFLFYTTTTEAHVARPKITFIRIATAYTAFVLLKFSVEKIISNILSIDKRMDYFQFYKLSYRNYMALILLPANLIFVYVWPANLTVLLAITGILLLFNLIVIFDLLKKNQQFVLENLFYFILYLCALEIGPYFILYKLFTT